MRRKKTISLRGDSRIRDLNTPKLTRNTKAEMILVFENKEVNLNIEV